MQEENAGGKATTGICNEGRRQTNLYQLITNANVTSKQSPDQAKYPPIRLKWAVKCYCAVRISWCQLGWRTGVTLYHLLVDSEVELLLQHVVHLLSFNQAHVVRPQNPKRRVVLEGYAGVGAGILLLVEEPHTGWDSHNSEHAEDDQDGQHRAGLCAQQATVLAP